MLILLSPSKTQDFTSPSPALVSHYDTEPPLLAFSIQLIKELRKLSPEEISSLMNISEKLASLNHERYRYFHVPFTKENARPAIYAFKGDVYDGLDAASFNAEETARANKHLCILSGLYGLLHGCDLIQPYRLEMKTPLSNPLGKDLYAFWSNRITEAINHRLQETGSTLVLNLASQEYFTAVKPKKLATPLATAHFKERKGNELKVIGLFAKRARGQMARFIMKHRIENLCDIKTFEEGGYRFDNALSDETNLVFVR